MNILYAHSEEFFEIQCLMELHIKSISLCVHVGEGYSRSPFRYHIPELHPTLVGVL